MEAKILEQLLLTPVAEEYRKLPVTPKCPHCKRRGSFRQSATPGPIVRVSDKPEDGVILIQRYEFLPCCTAHYLKTVNHMTRREKLFAARHRD